MKISNRISSNKGSILILGLLMMAVLLMIGGVFLSLTTTNYSMLISDSDTLRAYWIAHAGVKKAIYDIKDDFSKYIHTLNKYEFSDGEYELSITSLDTTGIRNILCMSIGTYKNSSYAMAAEVQLDTPTDYLYFFDGNGEFGTIDAVAPVVLGGPVHSNAHLRFTPWHNYLYVIKPAKIKGPTISAAGLVTRSEAYNPGTDGFGYQSPVMIEEGDVSFNNNFIYTGTVPDKSLAYSTWTFKVFKRPSNPTSYDPTITYPDDFTSSDFAMSPVNSSPVETFPTTNTPLGLLNDGYHNGYRIHVPTIRKVTPGTKYKATEYADLPLMSETEWENTISEYYKDYIDERWYIRGRKNEDSYGNKYYTISNSSGLNIKEFVNDTLRRKFVLGKGNGANIFFSIPGYYPKVEEIGRQNSSGSLKEFVYFPSRNRIKNVYINGINVNTTPNFGAYYINAANVYYDNSINTFSAANSKIAFDTPPSNTPKNIKVKFYPTTPCMIGRGDGVTKVFEYYPTTITDVLVDNVVRTNGGVGQYDYTIPNGDHSATAVALTAIDNITYETPEKILPRFFKSDTIEIFQNSISIYSGQGGTQPDANDPYISSIDYLRGRITFKSSQAGNTITAKYIARAIVFNNAPPISPYRVGVKYTGYVTIAEGYNSSDSNPALGRAREFNFSSQQDSNLITELTVDAIDAYYIVSDTYHRNYTQAYGWVVFKNPPPANTSIGIDYVKNVYLINRNEPEINNEDLGEDNELSTDFPPLNNNKTWGVYRWYDYEIINNQIKFQNSGASNLGFGLSVLGPEPSPVPVQNSFVCVDTPIKAVEIDLDKVTPVPSQGIIFSEVPVIVKGSPKEPITIICLADVYVQSINDRFSDDSNQAAPVGILSAGAIWVDHSEVFRLDVNHPDWDSNNDVIMNKVSLYTTRGFFYTGGRQYRNRMRFVGSVCNLANDFGSSLKETDSSSFYYTDKGKLVRGYAYRYLASDGVTQIIGSAQLYPISFRADKTISSASNHRPPPHMPVYIQIKYFKGIVSTDAKKFIESIKSYVENGQKIPAEIYNELITKL